MAQYNTFYIPLQGEQEQLEALNVFMRSHRVLSVDKQFAGNGWAFCVEWQEGTGNVAVRQEPGRKSKVDYREVLSAEDFEVFSRLRAKRKELAAEHGEPPFMVMTDAQLKDIVEGKVTTVEELKAVRGVGEARAKKYGEALLEVMRIGNLSTEGTEDTEI